MRVPVAVAVLVLSLVAAAGCSATAEIDSPAGGVETTAPAVSAAERAAVLSIFDEIQVRFPNASPSGDLVFGGPCPFGEQYGELLIEGDQILCIIESTFEISGVSPSAVGLIFVEEFAAGELDGYASQSGDIVWSAGEVDGDFLVIVERVVDGLSVYSAQLGAPRADEESVAIRLHEELAQTAEERLRKLAETDLNQILATAEEVYDT